MKMRTGMQFVQKAMDSAKAATQNFSSGTLLHCSWTDGETKVLRFLTDDVITCDFYEWVIDNQGKRQSFIIEPSLFTDDEGNIDPKYHGEDYVLKYGGQEKEYKTGALIDPKKVERSIVVAVEREEAPRQNPDGSQNLELRYRDKLEPITIKDVEYMARRFVVVRQSYRNFWNTLVGYFHEFGTLCDRDYKITRSGGGTDTVYQIIPLREDKDFDIKELQAHYGYGKTRKEDDSDRYLFCPMTLQEWATKIASEERAKALLSDPRKTAAESRTTPSGNGGGSGYTPSGNDEFHPDTTHNDEAQAAAPPPQTKDMAALHARLERHKT